MVTILLATLALRTPSQVAYDTPLGRARVGFYNECLKRYPLADRPGEMSGMGNTTADVDGDIFFPTGLANKMYVFGCIVGRPCTVTLYTKHEGRARRDWTMKLNDTTRSHAHRVVVKNSPLADFIESRSRVVFTRAQKQSLAGSAIYAAYDFVRHEQLYYCLVGPGAAVRFECTYIYEMLPLKHLPVSQEETNARRSRE